MPTKRSTQQATPARANPGPLSRQGRLRSRQAGGRPRQFDPCAPKWPPPLADSERHDRISVAPGTRRLGIAWRPSAIRRDRQLTIRGKCGRAANRAKNCEDPVHELASCRVDCTRPECRGARGRRCPSCREPKRPLGLAVRSSHSRARLGEHVRSWTDRLIATARELDRGRRIVTDRGMSVNCFASPCRPCQEVIEVRLAAQPLRDPLSKSRTRPSARNVTGQGPNS